MAKRERRTFTNEFKEQIVKLHLSGKPRSEIIKEYELTPSAYQSTFFQKTSQTMQE